MSVFKDKEIEMFYNPFSVEKNIHLGSDPIFVEKGQKQRVAYVLPRVVYNLKAYILRFHGNKPELDSFLFFSPMGEGKEADGTCHGQKIEIVCKKSP